MSPLPLSDDTWYPQPGQYAQICGTADEWEDVIGILEERVLGEEDEEEHWILYVPTAKSDLRSRRMIGVNDLTDYVRYQLSHGDNRINVSPKNLERVDPADF